MKRVMMILAVASLMAAGAAGVTAAEATLYQQYEAMVAGADYVLSMQFPSGGWGWRADYTAPSTATIGATGVGMLRAYDLTGNTAYLDSAEAAGNFRMDNKYANGDPRFATFDPYFMWQLSLRAGDNTWSDYAAAGFFGELAAGTYGPDDDWDTAEYISLIQGVRAETGSAGSKLARPTTFGVGPSRFFSNTPAPRWSTCIRTRSSPTIEQSTSLLVFPNGSCRRGKGPGAPSMAFQMACS